MQMQFWKCGFRERKAAMQQQHCCMEKKNPSGKLAMSFPYGSGQIPVSYDMAPTGRPKADLVQEPRYKSQYLDIPNEPLYSFDMA